MEASRSDDGSLAFLDGRIVGHGLFERAQMHLQAVDRTSQGLSSSDLFPNPPIRPARPIHPALGGGGWGKETNIDILSQEIVGNLVFLVDVQVRRGAGDGGAQ